MPSIISHAAVPLAMRLGGGKSVMSWRLFILAVFCSMAPDLDVFCFKFGIPYQSQWGHRGFTHSLFFAAVVGLIAACFYRELKSGRLAVFLVIFIAMASHGLLDALTNGGRGVALFWPFSIRRYAFPWRPIEVAPIGFNRFVRKGIPVLRSELIWIWLPCFALAGLAWLLRKKGSCAPKSID